MLKVTKLNKYYYNFGRKPLHVIDNTSLEIPKTGIIAVVGQSGAGKTTLINTISGLDSFKSGEIAFEDVKMRHYHNHIADKLRMKNFGFIFQNYYLLENKSVYENVKLSLDAFDINESEKKKRVHYVLDQLGIAKYTNKRVSSLSGGEQQRVSIARALVKSPSVIFADEPTGSLDEKTTFNVLNILKKISKTCAVFIVTHEREIISYYADYIIEIEKGLVVKEFKPTIPEGKSLSVDQNIYLKELDHKESFEKESISFNMYSDGQDVPNNTEVKIAFKDNKIYLEASDDIVVLDKKGESHLIDDVPYKIENYVNDDSSYELEPLNYTNNRIGFGETIKRGYKNFKTKRPIKRLLKVMCFTLSVVLMGLLEGANALSSVDLSNDLSASKGNLYVQVGAGYENVSLAQIGEVYRSIAKEVLESPLKGDISFDAKDTLVYNYDGFFQVQSKRYPLPSHDYKHISFLNKKDLVVGHMPEKHNEIVIDEYILEKFIDTSLLRTVITDYGHFVGKTLISSAYNHDLIISGVCRTKSPTVFGDYFANFARMSYEARCRVVDLEYLISQDPSYQDFSLEKGQCLVSYDYAYNIDSSLLNVKGYIPSSMPFDLIIHKDDYPLVQQMLASFRSPMIITCDGKTESINAFKSIVEHVIKSANNQGIKVKGGVNYTYQEQYNKAVGTFENILFVVRIIAGVIAVIALLFIILSTYFSMLSQIGEIAVYRSLGYSRLNLGFAYFVELFLTTFIYTLLGLVSTYAVLFIVDVIPIIEFTISTSILEFLYVFLGLLGVILVIGLLPIAIVFIRTPANLYNRFHRRIEGI